MQRPTPGLSAVTLAIALLPVITGCSWFHRDGPQKVDAPAYYAPAATLPPGNPATESPSNPAAATPATDNAAPARSDQLPSASAPLLADQVLSDTVLKNVRPPEQVVTGALAPAASPTTRRGVSMGQYITLGGVMATVNGAPIFANRVMKTLEVALAAKARELESRQFRSVSADLIQRQVREFVNSELEFAAAQKALEKDDRKIADFLTIRWRQEQVTAAGGSVEMTKRRYAQSGQDFEEEVRNQYRLYMIRLYYERKIVPRIHVTAADMRAYYKANLNRKFTDHSELEFQLIKIDARKAGTPQAAQERAKALYARATSGEDFTQLASTANDDARLARAKGAVGTIERGAFALEKVEEACWKAAPGQVTDLVDEGGNFYIAKVTAKRLGNTRSFDDQAVQDEVKSDLRTQQFRKLQQDNRDKLIGEAVIVEVPGMNATAVDMAMQRYATWRQSP